MHDLDRIQFGYGGEMEDYGLPGEAPALSDAEEMQLAADLMELQTEEEFENFLTDLISGIAKAAGGFLNSSAGKALGGLLKGAAKKLLPVAGTAIGGILRRTAGCRSRWEHCRECRRGAGNGNGRVGMGGGQDFRSACGRCSQSRGLVAAR